MLAESIDGGREEEREIAMAGSRRGLHAGRGRRDPFLLVDKTSSLWTLFLRMSQLHTTAAVQYDNSATKIQHSIHGHGQQCRLSFSHIPKTGGTAIENAGHRHGILWGQQETRWKNATMGEWSIADASVLTCPYTEQQFTGLTKSAKTSGERPCCHGYHLPGRFLKPAGGDCGWNFCVLRDVHSRLASEFFHQRLLVEKHMRSHRQDLVLRLSMRQYFLKSISRDKCDSWVNSRLQYANDANPFHADCHFLKQTLYLASPKDGEQRRFLTVDELPRSGCARSSPPACGGCNIVLRHSRLRQDFRKLMRWAGGSYTNVSVSNTSSGNASLYQLPLSATVANSIASFYEDDMELNRIVDPEFAGQERKGT